MIARSAAVAALGLLVLALLACTATRPPASAPSSQGWQTLYRVQYDTADGKGSFRLLLKRPLIGGGDERFDLAASDPLGRTLWALQVVDGEGSWFDFRARRVCEIGRRFRLDALHLPELPLAALPRILAGEPPRPDGPSGPSDGVDADGRTWTLIRGPQGQLIAWHLSEGGSEGGKPTLRYEVEPLGAGGTLISESSRLRFRRVAHEPLATLPPLRAPAPDFTRGGCEAVALP